MTNILLEVKDLRVHYHKIEALKCISLKSDERMIAALIGANGAGKTTLLRSISGLKVPTSGSILFRGERIDGKTPQDIVKLGIAHVPEGRRIFPYMTVLENLKMGAFLRNIKSEIEKDIEDLFVHFPILKRRIKQQAGTLSGGEQQMLAQARALMSKPVLMLLDEPTLGLAPFMVREVAQIVIRINRTGVSSILVEQNARMALKIAHRGYVLETGNIALKGDANVLIDNEHVKKAFLGG